LETPWLSEVDKEEQKIHSSSPKREQQTETGSLWAIALSTLLRQDRVVQ
jgi:hypothetical protein